jgi:hypothetical protein
MPLHGIFVFSAPIWQGGLSGTTIVSRQFQYNAREKQQDFEALLQAEGSNYLSVSPDAVFSMTLKDGIYVVGQRVGQLVVYACGTDEVDEIPLSALVSCVRGVILSLVRPESLGSDLLEAEIPATIPLDAPFASLSDRDVLVPAVYGVLTVSIDEIVTSGIYDVKDMDRIIKGAKLKI